MIKKKTCKRTIKRTTKKGKWSEEYKVKLSVKPVKRKKSGTFAKRRARDYGATKDRAHKIKRDNYRGLLKRSRKLAVKRKKQ